MVTPSLHSREPASRSSGFTMIEALIVIVIMAILFSIAVPAFLNLIARQRVVSAASDMYAALLLARSEAQKRNTTVSVTATNSSDWSQGWTVGITGTVVQTQSAIAGNVAIDTTVGGTARSVVAFTWTGRPDAASNGTSIRVYSSAYTSVAGRCISLALSGMPEIKNC